jgi:ribonuclease T1
LFFRVELKGVAGFMRYRLDRWWGLLTGSGGHFSPATLWLKVSLALLVLVVSTAAFSRTSGSAEQNNQQAMSVIALGQLPKEGRETYALIFQGGPFPYGKDGTVFGNRERLLPRHPRGYYREYTVNTPRLSHRGKRRIVCGGENPRQPKDCYYTQDHYASFARIAPQ